MSFLVKNLLEFDNEMKFMKNTITYTELPSELELEVEQDPEDWPLYKFHHMQGYVFLYKNTPDTALKSFSITVNVEEKTKFLGRTGSSKRSIISIFSFSTISYMKKIFIDGVV